MTSCYYSNLIEGHDTHPVDIERALKGDYSAEPEKRSLQLEAEAHIAVQEWIDGGGIEGRAATAAGLMEIHRRFCERLPEEALAEFTRFFLQVCIDQMKFMENLMAPDRLRTRILIWVEEEVRVGALPPKSGAVLEAVLFRGELPRGDVAAILGTRERQARRVTAALLEGEILVSESSRAPLRLAFPARHASRWMPGLFPENPE